MIGRPEIRTQDEGPQLVLGGIGFGPNRGPLHEKMRTYLSEDTLAKFDDLLTGGPESETYRRWQISTNLIWGNQLAETPDVSMGIMGLSAFSQEQRPHFAGEPDLPTAESWLVYLDPANTGKSLATRSYEHMVYAGLHMGLPVVTALVRVENTNSIKLHRRCGFVTVRELAPDESKPEKKYFDMRLYNPVLGKTAIQHALSLADDARLWDLVPVDSWVNGALVRVAQTLKKFDYVRQAIESEPEAVRAFKRSVTGG